MNAGFPKNHYKLHSAVTPRPFPERIINTQRNKTAMFINRIVKWRKKKGYGFKRFK